MRTFILRRDNDLSGISGTGDVAQGIEFDNGVCAMQWLTKYSSTVVYPNMHHVVAIHGHNGATRVIWSDHDELRD